MQLHTKVNQLNTVGKALEKRLQHLGIETVADLLFYFPFRYEDYTQNLLIKNLGEGQQVTIKVKIQLIASKRSPRKRKLLTEALVADETGELRVIWFGQPYIVKALKVGDSVYLSGKVTMDMLGAQMVNPAYEKVRREPPQPADAVMSTHTAKIVPMYPLTYGITQKQMRFLVSEVLPLAQAVPEWLPPSTQERVDLMPLSEALRAIHFPSDFDELKHAEKRLKFDELFVLQLRAEMIRQSVKRYQAPKIHFQEAHTKEFVAGLPFTLTKDQKIAAWEILQDMEKSEPMNRLLEGDVGSGKTVVAALAAYNALLDGYQAVVMAPTEILAFQHYETMSKIFVQMGASVGLLTRSRVEMSDEEKVKSKKLKESFGKCKKMFLDAVKKGEVQIVIGTHALLSEDVEFKKLGLVVVDEQHRFGVEQRKTIREKSGNKNSMPHFLSMTATPIPRSFALTLYGDLDLSIIREKPAGRKEIKTRVVSPHNREKAYAFIREQVKGGRQVFVICPLIEEKTEATREDSSLSVTPPKPSPYRGGVIDRNEKKSVMQEYEKLKEKVFPDLRVGYVHGKLKSDEKAATMEQFNRGTIDILVSTSVVEVGVNIPNASVMMIEGAERFGLAQLHQFRGRVGRSDHQSYCFLFTDSASQKVAERLEFFERTTDGFALSEYDLQVRGPGEVYGTTQSGMMNFRLATMRDVDIIKLAREAARGIDFGKYPILKEKVKEWERRVHLE